MDRFYKLKKEYSASGTATAIAGGELKIFWKNNVGGFPLEVGDSAEVIFGGGAPAAGLVSMERDGEVFTFNVIKTEDDEDGESCYIIELIASRRLGGIVQAEAVRGYIKYICSEIRAAAEDIASVTDRLFGEVLSGTFGAARAAEGFERICEIAAVLEREAVYPENIYSLADPLRRDDVIVLDREMAALASGIRSSLTGGARGTVRISEDYDREIFFRMNTDSFETALASMAAECCGGGRPERLIFSARRSGRGRAEITVMSLDIGGVCGKAGQSGFVSEKSFNRRLLAEYVYDVLSLKNGARFSKEIIPGGTVYRMNIEALPRGAAVFAEKPVDGSDRQREIAEKIAFFFGNDTVTETRRYMPPEA